VTVLAHAEQDDVQSVECVDQFAVARSSRFRTQFRGDGVEICFVRRDGLPQVLLDHAVVARRIAARQATFISQIEVHPFPRQGLLRQV